MAVRDVIRRWYANSLAFSFDFIADLSNHMVLQSGKSNYDNRAKTLNNKMLGTGIELALICY